MHNKSRVLARFYEPAKVINAFAIQQAEDHQSRLTKPAGSLGQLEDIAIQFAGWQAKPHPKVSDISIVVFAGDHGVCAQGVSAFPQIVTTQMVANFASGGAAISVLSKMVNADFRVVNVGVANPIADAENVVNHPVAKGSADFTMEPAMSQENLEKALLIGCQQAEHQQADIFIGGEMGIGNTTSASALLCTLLSLTPEDSVGPGTGVDQDGMQRKQAAIEKGLTLHVNTLSSPLDALRCLGGYEIAALVGAYITCAQRGTPILVDGFISTAAALVAEKINPSVRHWFLFAHQSAEPAHQAALTYFKAKPLLNLGMRLGEGSGAAVAVSLIQTALALHNSMATFEQAGVTSSE